MHSYPNKINWPAITAALGDAPDTTKAAACYAEWLSRGYNPKSIKPFTEWYCVGIPEQGRPAAPTTRPQNGRPVARVQADYSTPDKLNAARERSRKAIAERRAQEAEAQHAPI